MSVLARRWDDDDDDDDDDGGSIVHCYFSLLSIGAFVFSRTGHVTSARN